MTLSNSRHSAPPQPHVADATQHAPPVLGALVRLAAPLVLGSLLTLLMIVADRFWVGGLGSEALAGLGVAQATLVLLTTLLLGTGLGTLAGVARHTGARQPGAAAATLGAGLWLGAAAGLVLCLAGVVLPGWVMQLGGVDPFVGAGASSYLQITLAGTLLQGPLLVVLFALQGAGAGRAALKVGAVAPLTNLLLDPLGVHWLGLAGAAWVTVLANGLALVAAVWVLRGQRALLPLRAEHLRLDRARLRAIAAVGVPGTCEHLVRNGAGFGLVMLVAPCGAAVVAGYTAGLAVLLLLIHPGLALGQATASLVGQALGAGDRHRAWRVAWTGAGLYAGLMTLAALVIWRWAPELIGCFAASPEAIAAGAGFLRTLAVAFPGLALVLVLGKALHGAKRSWPVFGAAAGAHLVVQLPLVWLLSRWLGADGAWLGMAVAFVTQALLLVAAVQLTLGEARLPRLRPALVRVAASGLLAAGLLALGGCQAVDFTEKRHLSDPIMELGDGPAHTHWQQKVTYSREGSAGGIGASAGGGCGCY